MDSETADTVEIKDDFNEEIIIENSPEPIEADIEENVPVENELSDEDLAYINNRTGNYTDAMQLIDNFQKFCENINIEEGLFTTH